MHYAFEVATVSETAMHVQFNSGRAPWMHACKSQWMEAQHAHRLQHVYSGTLSCEHACIHEGARACVFGVWLQHVHAHTVSSQQACLYLELQNQNH